MDCVRTYRCDEVNDDEGIKHWYYGCTDGSHDVAQALETAKEAEDSESPKHLGQKKGK
jgi:Iap family predicted aminopeptidase